MSDQQALRLVQNSLEKTFDSQILQPHSLLNNLEALSTRHSPYFLATYL